MIVDIERYIHEGIADQGATEFMRALSKVCMDISVQTGNNTSEEKRIKQVWLTVSARMSAMSEFVFRAGLNSPFIMRESNFKRE